MITGNIYINFGLVFSQGNISSAVRIAFDIWDVVKYL